MKHTITTLSEENNIGGTSYHDIVINASKNEIEKKLGIHAYVNKNDSITKYEWDLELDNKIPFTIYDYNMHELGEDDVIEYHVGWKTEPYNDELDNDGFPTSIDGLYIVEALVERGFSVSPSKVWQMFHSNNK